MKKKLKDKFKNGQVWQCRHPLCWTILLIFCDMDGDDPLFAVMVLGTNIDRSLSAPMFHCGNMRRHPNYLYSPKELNELVGDGAKEPLNKRCEFVEKDGNYYGY